MTQERVKLFGYLSKKDAEEEINKFLMGRDVGKVVAIQIQGKVIIVRYIPNWAQPPTSIHDLFFRKDKMSKDMDKEEVEA